MSKTTGPFGHSGAGVDLRRQCVRLTADQATSFSLLDALVDNQLNFIDTADVYSSWAPGNRGRIGNRHRRMAQEERQARPVIIATKVGKPMGEGKQAVAALYSAGGGRPLRRLQTDYIDLTNRTTMTAIRRWKRRWRRSMR